MDDISSLISSLLENPQTVQNLKDTVSELLDKDSKQEEAKKANTVPSVDPNILSVMMKLAPVLKAVEREDDNTRLLNALRPYLGDERKKTLDESKKLLQLMQLIPLIKDQGIL